MLYTPVKLDADRFPNTNCRQISFGYQNLNLYFVLGVHRNQGIPLFDFCSFLCINRSHNSFNIAHDLRTGRLQILQRACHRFKKQLSPLNMISVFYMHLQDASFCFCCNGGSAHHCPASNSRHGCILRISEYPDTFIHIEQSFGNFNGEFLLVLFIHARYHANSAMAAVCCAGQIHGFSNMNVAIFAVTVTLFIAAIQCEPIGRLYKQNCPIPFGNTFRVIAFAGKYSADRSIHQRVNLIRSQCRYQRIFTHIISDMDINIVYTPSVRCRNDARIACSNFSCKDIFR